MVNNSASFIDITKSNNYRQINTQIDYLLDCYFSLPKLNQYKADFPAQLNHNQARKWKRISWQQINSELIDLDINLFLDILTGIINTEVPIRDYTQATRQYLEQVNPKLASFVGGKVDKNGNILELGLWEKEERRHAPILIKVYQQLREKKFVTRSKKVRAYQPTNKPREHLYKHGLHRIITEYGAVCLYLWLMSHTKGELQKVFGELVEDELNHTIKFWAMGVYLFPEKQFNPFLTIIQSVLNKHTLKHSQENYSSQTLLKTFKTMMETLHWQRWNWSYKRELISFFIKVMIRLISWHRQLNSEDLQQLLN